MSELRERRISTNDLVLVRRPKPCTAELQVGDRVYFNGLSSRYTVPVLSIDGETIIIECQNWKGELEEVEFPRPCFRKAHFRSWLYNILKGKR
jgi:hypothetical protein